MVVQRYLINPNAEIGYTSNFPWPSRGYSHQLTHRRSPTSTIRSTPAALLSVCHESRAEVIHYYLGFVRKGSTLPWLCNKRFHFSSCLDTLLPYDLAVLGQLVKTVDVRSVQRLCLVHIRIADIRDRRFRFLMKTLRRFQSLRYLTIIPPWNKGSNAIPNYLAGLLKNGFRKSKDTGLLELDDDHRGNQYGPWFIWDVVKKVRKRTNNWMVPIVQVAVKVEGKHDYVVV